MSEYVCDSEWIDCEKTGSLSVLFQFQGGLAIDTGLSIVLNRNQYIIARHAAYILILFRVHDNAHTYTCVDLTDNTTESYLQT
jgi:hypothetical protein